jgi:hypothetical protein
MWDNPSVFFQKPEVQATETTAKMQRRSKSADRKPSRGN